MMAKLADNKVFSIRKDDWKKTRLASANTLLDWTPNSVQEHRSRLNVIAVDTESPDSIVVKFDAILKAENIGKALVNFIDTEVKRPLVSERLEHYRLSSSAPKTRRTT